MAGAHADLPAPRIEYDRDGTRVYRIWSGVTTEEGASTLQMLNDEALGNNNWDTTSLFIIFPYAMDISHVYIDKHASTAMATVTIQSSTDSTDGQNGTWTTIQAGVPVTTDQTVTRHRSDIIALTTPATGVQMLKVTCNADRLYLRSLHLYGKASTGQSLHRMRFWHPTLDEPLDNHPTHLDWGNIQQNSVATKTFRVKNDSPSLTASGITVFMQALTEVNPTQVSQHQLSADGTTFVAAASPGLSVSSLAAQAISPVLSLRRNTLVNAQLALSRQRLVVGAATWA